MYIPKAEKDTDIYAYDVNSLYPAVMKDSVIPVGNPMFFKGDILEIDKMHLDFSFVIS
jgi:hypothetical protein